MAIGKLLPVLLRRCALSAHRPDRKFAVGKLGHQGGSKGKHRSAFKIFEALSLRRYHSRKRNVKPVLMASSIIRFRANCLRSNGNFPGVRAGSPTLKAWPVWALKARLEFSRLE